jgi:translin
MDHAGQIAAAGSIAQDDLERKHAARETALVASRRTIRSCANAIRAVHRHEYRAARELVAVAAAYVSEMDASVEGQPEIRYTGYFHDAKKEFVEANLTLAFVAGHPMATAAELGVDAAAYLNGMAEAASELRRQVLDRLRADDTASAERLLGLMDDVYAVLITVDYPDALTGGLRRTTDALRAVLERTRGDVTTALVAVRLRAAIDAADQRGGRRDEATGAS